MKRILMAGVAAIAFTLPTAAFAVDVTNQDNQTHWITTFTAEDGKEAGDGLDFEILAGQTLKGICNESCLMVLGKDVTMQADLPSLTVHDPQHAYIKDGQFKVQ